MTTKKKILLVWMNYNEEVEGTILKGTDHDLVLYLDREPYWAKESKKDLPEQNIAGTAGLLYTEPETFYLANKKIGFINTK